MRVALCYYNILWSNLSLIFKIFNIFIIILHSSYFHTKQWNMHEITIKLNISDLKNKKLNHKWKINNIIDNTNDRVIKIIESACTIPCLKN